MCPYGRAFFRLRKSPFRPRFHSAVEGRFAHDRIQHTDNRPRYFKWAFIVTVPGFCSADGSAGSRRHHRRNDDGVLSSAPCLPSWEISLSFDNAIVNANKLKDMTPVWQQRFLTWGILIAVFGMRIVFPLLIVVIARVSVRSMP